MRLRVAAWAAVAALAPAWSGSPPQPARTALSPPEVISTPLIDQERRAGPSALPAAPRPVRRPATRRRSWSTSTSTSCRASWYGERFRGRRTTSGERFDPDALTAAHRSLRFGTRLLVRHGSRSVPVRITDRGPFAAGRCLDLSRAAFARLAHPRAGVIAVEYAVTER